jgi:hypothetical protein
MESEKPELDRAGTDTFGTNNLLYFESNEAVFKYIENIIVSTDPDRVLIVEGRPQNKATLIYPLYSNVLKYPAKYIIYENKNNNFDWLCQTTEDIRKNKTKSIILTNYPRKSEPPVVSFYSSSRGNQTIEKPQGTSLRLCEREDKSTRVAIFLIGPYATGYNESVYHSQANGREAMTKFEVLISASEKELLETEKEQLRACSNVSEQLPILQEIVGRIEKKTDTWTYSGGILT